jgi:Protein of unknown function (DUF3551)
MRNWAPLILALVFVTGLFGGLFSWAGSARAQTYDRNSPVCMQLSEWGGSRVECSYTSMAQCAATAAGLAGTCVPNPYFSFGRRDRRY